jgi:hypothetical protein
MGLHWRGALPGEGEWRGRRAAIRDRCAKKPDPGPQFGRKMLFGRGLSPEVNIIDFYQKLSTTADRRIRNSQAAKASYPSPATAIFYT